MGLVVTILLVVLLIYIHQKIPVWKGKYAEILVDKILSRLPEDYITFNDLLFKSNGYTVQIDHIVVSPFGIFVIETKGYQGWITGGENSEYWTQTIFKSKHKFYNPIRQNDGQSSRRVLPRILPRNNWVRKSVCRNREYPGWRRVRA